MANGKKQKTIITFPTSHIHSKKKAVTGYIFSKANKITDIFIFNQMNGTQ
jgi:hypothetical protein